MATSSSIIDTWLNFGCFHLVWRDMLAWFKDQIQIDFVFNPHPVLLTMFYSNQTESIISKKDVDYFFEEIRSLNNVFFILHLII